MKPGKKGSTTHFGFEEVPIEEKQRRVNAVFDSVASTYDLMNDILSFGMHRLWRRFAVRLSDVSHGQRVLDLAGGTGDLTARLTRLVGPRGQVVLADVNSDMLARGRARFANVSVAPNVAYVQADGEDLPFSDGCFDCVTIAFGLRNMTDLERALASVCRVLKPGRPVVVLEFSRPTFPGLKPIYDWYSFHVMPLLGRWITGDGRSHRYLAESIRVHPDQEKLQRVMEQAGFARCQYFNLAGGIVAIHRGYKAHSTEG